MNVCWNFQSKLLIWYFVLIWIYMWNSKHIITFQNSNINAYLYNLIMAEVEVAKQWKGKPVPSEMSLGMFANGKTDTIQVLQKI